MDTEDDALGIFMPITPGNFYRVWIEAVQWVLCGTDGAATSNISFRFRAGVLRLQLERSDG